MRLNRDGYEEGDEFNFAQVYRNEATRYIARCDDRLNRTTSFLREMRGRMSFLQMCRILRDHPKGWTPWNQEMVAVCQHAGHENAYASTCSQISQLGDGDVHWFTGSSSPCMSVFWPHCFENPVVYPGFDVGGDTYSKASYWWRRELVNRRLSSSFDVSLPLWSAVVGETQRKVYDLWNRKMDAHPLVKMLDDFEKKLSEIAHQRFRGGNVPAEYVEYWSGFNKSARIVL